MMDMQAYVYRVGACMYFKCVTKKNSFFFYKFTTFFEEPLDSSPMGILLGDYVHGIFLARLKTDYRVYEAIEI